MARAAGPCRSLLSGLPTLRQIFLGQRRSGRLGLHHARNPPTAGFFDRLNAVDAARDWLAIALQRVAAPLVRDVAVALNAKLQLLFFQLGVATRLDAGDPIIQGLDPIRLALRPRRAKRTSNALRVLTGLSWRLDPCPRTR